MIAGMSVLISTIVFHARDAQTVLVAHDYREKSTVFSTNNTPKKHILLWWLRS
jgi:hypothetical protein